MTCVIPNLAPLTIIDWRVDAVQLMAASPGTGKYIQRHDFFKQTIFLGISFVYGTPIGRLSGNGTAIRSR